MGTSASRALPSQDEVYQKICARVNNQKGVDRLIQLTRDQYPEQSLRWIHEKVLRDLERDQR